MNDDKQRLAEALGKVGPIVNGEQFAPGYDPAAAAYEQATRPPLELASSFLGDHQVVALLEAGARPLITYTVLAEPSGECRVMATFHGAAREDGTAENSDELTFAHVILLDMLRRQIDRVYEPGEAAKRMFAMAIDPDPLADRFEAEFLLRTQPAPEAQS